jgi:RNA polymerase sigma factor (sigma-70 family)
MCDNLPDAEAGSPADLCERSDRTVHIADLVQQVLPRLTQRQREVFRMTYLEPDSASATQLKVASTLGISAQRVQRILKAGLSQMRSAIPAKEYV